MAASEQLQTWWQAARAGDERARDALCRSLRPTLHRVAWAWLRDADEADDVAQEALVRLLTHRFFLGGPTHVQAWTSKVALNLARNRLRDRRRRGQLVAQAGMHTLQARGALAREGGDALDEILRRERRASAEQAFAGLSGRQQDVLRLRLWGQLDFAEIGHALRISEENARVTCAQARARMEKLMREKAERAASGGQP